MSDLLEIQQPSQAFLKVQKELENINSCDWRLIGNLVTENISKIVFEHSANNEPFLNILLKFNPPSELVGEVIKANPSALAEERKQLLDGRFSSLSLFVALNHNASGEVIRALVEAYPASLHIRNDDNKLAIHHAVESCRETSGLLEVLKVLLDCCPENIKEPTVSGPEVRGDLPLHLALKAKIHHECVKLLVDEWVESLNKADSEGNYPLNIALNLNLSVDTFKVLRSGHHSGHVDIVEYAINCNCSSDVIGFLASSYPFMADMPAIIKPPSDAFLAIKKLLKDYNERDWISVQKIVNENIDTIVFEWSNESLLNLLLTSNPPVEIIREVIAANPFALSEQKRQPPDGQLSSISLFIAILHCSSSEVIRTIIEAYPDALYKSNKFGQHAIHCVLYRKTVPILKVIVNHDPETVKVRFSSENKETSDGLLPLHYALELYDVNFETVKLLIDAWPESINEPDDKGQYPLDIAVRFRLNVSIFKLLKDGKYTGENIVEDSIRSKCDVEVTAFLSGCTSEPVLPPSETFQMIVKMLNDNNQQFDWKVVCTIVRDSMKTLAFEHSTDYEPFLNVLLKYNPPAELILEVIAANPSAVSEQRFQSNYNRMSPISLFVGVDYCAACEVLRVIAEVHPNSLRMKTPQGELAIHVLLSKVRDNRIKDVLKLLVELNPDCVQELDNSGHLPLHLALKTKAHHDCVEVLVNAWPQSVSKQLTTGEYEWNLKKKYPLEIAIENNLSAEIFLYLKNHHYPGDIVQDAIHYKCTKNVIAFLAEAVTAFTSPSLIRPPSNVFVEVLEMLKPNDASNWQSIDQIVKDNITTLAFEHSTDCEPFLNVLLKYDPPAELISEVIAANPSAVSEQRFQHQHRLVGSTSVIIAVDNDASEDVIKMLAKTNAQSLLLRDMDGNLAIHRKTCFSRKHNLLGAVKVMLEFNPQCVQERSKSGDLPLHLALKVKYPQHECIELLVEAWPDSVSEKDKNGDFPLDIAVTNNLDLTIVRILGKGTYTGGSIVEAAIECECSVDVIAFLADNLSSPASLSKIQPSSPTLHSILALLHSNEQIDWQSLDITVKSNMKTLAFEHSTDCEPFLNVLLKYNPPAELISEVIAANPSAVSEQRFQPKYKCMSPVSLIIAVDCGASAEVISLVVEAYPQALGMKDGKDSSILHRAVATPRESGLLEVLMVIIKHYPEGIKVRDKFGNLPIHLALNAKAAFECIKLLVDTWPDSINDEPNHLSQYPLDVAIRNSCDVNIIHLLKNGKFYTGKDILKAAVSSNCSAEVVTILANTQLERAGLPQIPTISDPCFAIFKLLFGVEYHEKPDWDSITRIVKDNLGTIVFELSPKRESFLNLLLQHNPPLKLVQEVIAANPSALSIQRRLPPDGYNSDLPIFVAWKRGLPGALIRIIAEAYPRALHRRDSKGRTAALQFVREICGFDMLKVLVEFNPDSVKERDLFGNMLLHTALLKLIDDKSITLLVDAFPESVNELDGNGLYPLDLAVKHHAKVEVFKILRHGKYTGLRISAQNVPLCLTLISSGNSIVEDAIKNKLSKDVIMFLAETANFSVGLQPVRPPSGSFLGILKLLKHNNRSDWRSIGQIVKDNIDTIVFEHSTDCEPFLNVLLKYNPPAELISEVIAANPSAVSEQRLQSACTSLSQVALLVAVDHCASAEVIRSLVMVYPGALKKRNGDDLLPIQLLFRRQRQYGLYEVLKVLVEFDPESVKERVGSHDYNVQNYLPLHLALQTGAHYECIKLLVETWPESASIADGFGYGKMFPLHIAIFKGSNVGVFKALKDGIFPGGNIVEHAVAYGCSKQVITFLVRNRRVESQYSSESTSESSQDCKYPDYIPAVAREAFEFFKIHREQLHNLNSSMTARCDIGDDLQAEQLKSESIIVEALQKDPSIAKSVCKTEDSLLIFALQHSVPLSVIRAILDVDSMQVTIRSCSKSSPLYIALEHRVNEAIISLLYSTLVVRVKQPVSDEETISLLRCAVRNLYSLDAVRLFEPASTYVPKDSLLLVDALIYTNKATESVLLFLLDIFPTLVSMKARVIEHSIEYPLWVAVKASTDISIVRKIAVMSPVDAFYRYPPSETNILTDLFDSYSECPADKLSILRVFLQICPSLPTVATSRRELPLHDLLRKSGPIYTVEILEMTKALFSSYKDAMFKTDTKGNLPLGTVLLREYHVPQVDVHKSALVIFLVDVDPQALLRCVCRSDYIVHVEATRNTYGNLSMECVAHLLCRTVDQANSLFPDVLVNLAENSETFADLDTAESRREGPYADRLAVAFIKELFARCPDKVNYFCHSKDKHGRQVVQFVSMHIRECLTRYMYFCGRYEMHPGAPIHCSATAIVIAFTDHNCVSDYSAVFKKAAVNSKESNKENFAEADGSLCLDKFTKCLLELATATGASRLSENELMAAFDHYACVKTGKEAIIREADFIHYCGSRFGETRKVVIKFMRHEEQYQRERDIREKGELSGQFVVSLLRGPDEAVFASQVTTLTVNGGKLSLADFKYGLVMPAADRSLDAIFRAERPDMQRVRAIMYDVCMCVKHLHDSGVIHGDLKMLNVLRVNGDIKLIDMDAACPCDVGFVGNKFSSGVLPPEMFAMLSTANETIFKSYWHRERTANTELWDKIQPRRTPGRGFKAGHAYVVKTFKMQDGEPLTTGLPYELVVASPAVDIWALGVMLFTLVSGQNLLQVNRDDDLVKHEDIHTAATWTTDLIRRKITSSVPEPLVADLLCKLLEPNLETRIFSVDEVLKHEFFDLSSQQLAVRGGGNADLKQELSKFRQSLEKQYAEQKELLLSISNQTRSIETNTKILMNITDKMLVQIKRTEQVLLKGMFEAADVTVPSCFIILNQKLEVSSSGTEKQQSNMLQSVDAKVEKAGKWIDKLAQLGSTVTSVLDDVSSGVNKVLSTSVSEAIKQLTEGEELWLYLVDEYTMKPVVVEDDSVYPIAITQPKEFVPKILPLLKLSLKAITMVNSAATLVKCLGYPIPVIPDALLSGVQSAVGKLSQKSSVEEFDVLQNVLDTKNAHKEKKDFSKDKEEAKLVRGAALRELARFLASADQQCTFSGLRRVATPDGMCCWTSDDHIELIQGNDEYDIKNADGSLQADTDGVVTIEAVLNAEMMNDAEAQKLCSDDHSEVMAMMTEQLRELRIQNEKLTLQLAESIKEKQLSGAVDSGDGFKAGTADSNSRLPALSTGGGSASLTSSQPPHAAPTPPSYAASSGNRSIWNAGKQLFGGRRRQRQDHTEESVSSAALMSSTLPSSLPPISK